MDMIFNIYDIFMICINFINGLGGGSNGGYPNSWMVLLGKIPSING